MEAWQEGLPTWQHCCSILHHSSIVVVHNWSSFPTWQLNRCLQCDTTAAFSSTQNTNTMYCKHTGSNHVAETDSDSLHQVCDH